VTRILLLERQMARFLRKPVSVRSAAGVIVTTTALIVVASGVLMRVLDHREYPNVFVGMWWAIQTVTTVGYGDVTPRSVSGRIVATVVMLEAIALVAIVTAAITSTFVARASHFQDLAAADAEVQREAEVDRRFDDLADRLDRLETMLRSRGAQDSEREAPA
jgi:voltage-gated potassium channel